MDAPRVFLSGPMGSGKSTVARLVAQALRVAAVDLDALIEARVGMPIADWFKRHGEPAFRALEGEVLRAFLGGHADGFVMALGGGTVTSRALRHALLDTGVVVSLDASPAVLAARVGDGSARPLLAGANAEDALAAIREARADAYAECHGRVDTAERSPAEVAAQVITLVRRDAIVVALGARSYSVEIAAGLRTQLADRVAAHASGARVLVTDRVVDALWGSELRVGLARDGVTPVDVVLAPGESEKTLASVAQIWDAALGAGVDRDAIVIALGGGVIGDMAGFAASALLRGVAFAQLPTTLLAMVDSSVGGKTGVDHAQGKNLIGSVYQPRFVLCDVGFLATLPVAERRAGLGEVVKCALLAGERELAMLERDADALVAGDADATTRAIRMSVALKARIVASDEHETLGRRLLLNLGHTLGHALEAHSGYALRHGEAVALGLVGALRVAEGLRLGSAEQRVRVVQLLDQLGLPTDVAPRLSAEVLAWVGRDKKRAAGKVRFLVPVAPGDVRVVPLGLAQLATLCAST